MRYLLLLTMFFVTCLAGQELARVIHAAAPGYPQRVRQPEGEVQVELDLLPDGMVRKARAQSGPPMLRPVAEIAARQWRFAEGGPQQTKIVFAFILRDGVGDPPTVASMFKAPNRMEIFSIRRKVEVISDPPMGVVKEPK